MTKALQPLAGVRVADFGQLTAGANTSAMLADLGADVIKIESASYMDLFRHMGHDHQGDWWNKSSLFHFTNRNKRGVSVDLKNPAGWKIALDLIKRCDVVVENYSRGVLGRLGLDYETVSALNPRIVYACVTSQGETGPNRMHRTYGSTLDAMGGLAFLMGYPGEGPLITGSDFNYPDQVVSLLATGLVISALREAKRTGRGGLLDISQREVVSFLIGEEIAVASTSLDYVVPGRNGNEQTDLRLQDCFLAADGRWVAISIEDDAAETRVRAALGLGGDLRADMHAWIGSRTSAVVADALQQIDVIAWPVNDGRDLLADPELVGISLEKGSNGLLYKGMPYALEGLPFQLHGRAPDLGQDTNEILRTILELDDAEIDALETSGVTSNIPEELP